MDGGDAPEHRSGNSIFSKFFPSVPESALRKISKYLKSNDFTHVINCCVGSSLCSSDDNTDEQSLKQLYERNNIKYLSIILRDDPEADIFYHFSKIIKFLLQILKKQILKNL